MQAERSEHEDLRCCAFPDEFLMEHTTSNLKSLAERLIGKQYVDLEEVVDPLGRWVSSKYTFRMFREQIRRPENLLINYKAFKTTDLSIKSVHVRQQAHYYPSLNMSDRSEYETHPRFKFAPIGNTFQVVISSF